MGKYEKFQALFRFVFLCLSCRCVMAPLGSIDFCKFSDSPTSKRFCPDSVSAELIFHGLPVSKLITVLLKVCTAGNSGCACEDNVCPAVEKIVGLLSVEALWALIFLLTLSLGLLSSACVYMLCCRPAPRQVRTKCKTNQTSNVVVRFWYLCCHCWLFYGHCHSSPTTEGGRVRSGQVLLRSH